jgi:hypothetical protein
MITADVDETASIDSEAVGFKRLWAAVLGQAIRDYGVVDKVEHQGLHDAQYSLVNAPNLKKWLASGEVHVGSFAWICLYLDLDEKETRLAIYDSPGIMTKLRKA